MGAPSLEQQRSVLLDTQKRHALELMKSGIAQHALQRRYDETWYSDASTTDTPSESLPVVMFDNTNPQRNYIYVHLLRAGKQSWVEGTEVNIADIENPGQPDEVIEPIDGFTVDEAMLVKSLVDELIARKNADLPNLSNNLLAITES